MKFSKIATALFAAFAVAAPVRLPFDEELGLSTEHVPDETKRQNMDAALESISNELLGAIPDQFEDSDALDKIVEDLQNMVTSLLGNSSQILEAFQGDFDNLNSFITEVQLNNIPEDADITRRNLLLPIAKTIAFKLVKVILIKLLESLLLIRLDAGDELGATEE